jgi:hypothetical protein
MSNMTSWGTLVMSHELWIDGAIERNGPASFREDSIEVREDLAAAYRLRLIKEVKAASWDSRGEASGEVCD